MTRDEIMQLTDEELRNEIARVENWRYPCEREDVHYITHEMALDAGEPSLEGQEDVERWCDEGDGEPPHWETSIADVWQLEANIPEGQRLEYAKCLHTIIINVPVPYVPAGFFWEIIHASPADRCRAYLMWKEES